MGLKAIIFLLLVAFIFYINKDNFQIVKDFSDRFLEGKVNKTRERRDVDDAEYAKWLSVSSTHPPPSEKSQKPHKLLLSNHFQLNATVENHKIYTYRHGLKKILRTKITD